MKKRFLFLLVGLNLLLVSSVSMSIAWFLGSLRLTVNDILIKIDVDADLKISTDDNLEYAKDSLTEDDFGKVEGFIPVSSMLSEGSGWINDASNEKPSFIAQYKTGFRKDPQAKFANKGFFSKRFFLFSDHDMFVTFDSEKTTIKPNVRVNEAKAIEKAEDLTNKKIKEIAEDEIETLGIEDESEKQEIYERVKTERTEDLFESYRVSTLNSLNKIEDSLRISILDYENLTNSNYTIIDPKKSEDPVVFGGRLSTSIRKDYFDYYSDHDESDLKETLFGEILDQDHDIVYLPPATEDVPAEGEHTCFNAGTRKGVRALDMEDLKNNVTFAVEQSISPEVADVSKHSGNENEGYLIELLPNIPHPITLSVYLEGWDRDNVDATQEAAFDMSIHFKLYRQGDFK
ncbi:MAG: hypothetical protein K6E21_05400 [Bacilli bacterium]|nr:hypothetical protein [Bacilli bacterium]